MRLLQKILLLAITAIATAALAVPAMASAAEWTYEGTPLEENATATFQGALTFSGKSPNISISCDVSMKSTLQPGGEGTVDSFKAYFETCYGSILGCSPGTLLSAQELPWSMDALSSTEIGVGEIHLVSTFFSEFCPISKLEFKGEVVAFPDNPSAITSIEFNEESGSLQTNYPGYDVTVSGTLNVEPEGAYGIE